MSEIKYDCAQHQEISRDLRHMLASAANIFTRPQEAFIGGNLLCNHGLGKTSSLIITFVLAVQQGLLVAYHSYMNEVVQ